MPKKRHVRLNLACLGYSVLANFCAAVARKGRKKEARPPCVSGLRKGADHLKKSHELSRFGLPGGLGLAGLVLRECSLLPWFCSMVAETSALLSVGARRWYFHYSYSLRKISQHLRPAYNFAIM
jgi:hypothetical protein